MSEAESEQWVKITMARCQARRPAGWDVEGSEVVDEMVRVGFPRPVAARALGALASRGEAYETTTGWRLRTPTALSWHEASGRARSRRR